MLLKILGQYVALSCTYVVRSRLWVQIEDILLGIKMRPDKKFHACFCRKLLIHSQHTYIRRYIHTYMHIFQLPCSIRALGLTCMKQAVASLCQLQYRITDQQLRTAHSLSVERLIHQRIFEHCRKSDRYCIILVALKETFKNPLDSLGKINSPYRTPIKFNKHSSQIF